MKPAFAALISTHRFALSVACVFAGAALFFAAPYLTPLGFPSGLETGQRLSALNVSPYNRELEYAASICGAAILFLGVWTAPWRRLPARDDWIPVLGSILLVAVGLAVYGSGLKNVLLPFHEGEWLALGHGSPYPLIHGYLINYVPVRAVSALLGADFVIGGTRVFRLLLGLLAFALVPFVYHQVARYSVGRGWPNVLAVSTAIILFVLFHGTLFTVGAPQFVLQHMPVRDVPFVAMMLATVWLALPYRQTPATADRRLTARSACFGALAAAGLLVNILNAAFSAMLALLLAGYLVLCAGAGAGARLRRFALGAFGAFAAASVLAELVLPGSITATYRSIAHFSHAGRVTFADQASWLFQSVFVYYSAGGVMDFFTLGIGAVWVLDRVRREGVAGTLRTTFPYLVCLAAVAFSLFANTGTVSTTFGLALLLPIALGCFAATALARAPWFAALLESIGDDRNVRLALVAIGMCFLMFILSAYGRQALEAGRDVLRSTVQFDALYLPVHRFEPIKKRLDEGKAACTLSLPSDGSLLYALDRPSCIGVRFPIYDATRSGQDRMIEEMNTARPPLVHVASVAMDHHYPPYLHVPGINRYVLSRYRPDAAVEGRWFWSLAAPAVHRSAGDSGEVPHIRPSRSAFDTTYRIPVRGTPPAGAWAGALIYLKGQPDVPYAALVGPLSGGAVDLAFTVTGEIARAGAEIWLVGPGNVITRVADVDPM